MHGPATARHPGAPRALEENSSGSEKTQEWLSEPQESSWGRLPSFRVSLWCRQQRRGSRAEGCLSHGLTELLDHTSPEGS